VIIFRGEGKDAFINVHSIRSMQQLDAFCVKQLLSHSRVKKKRPSAAEQYFIATSTHKCCFGCATRSKTRAACKKIKNRAAINRNNINGYAERECLETYNNNFSALPDFENCNVN